ncbi:hypothetical protein ACFOWE_19210 [Planomonospora corallina]|uniref:Uncharacterized protein n=1 Tax=Planomonospora corallina TaxID=1806052 RepID=A0ABV8I8Y9_9ACTN
MSGTPAVPSPPSLSPPSAPRPAAEPGTTGRPGPGPAAYPAWSLPLHALRILGSCALSLLLWFSAGRAVRAALMWAGAEPAYGDDRVRLAVTVLVLTLIVLTEFVVCVGMLHSVRGALAEIRARRGEGAADGSLLGALDRAAPVFAAVYVIWGLHREDAREFAALDAAGRVGGDLPGALAGTGGSAGTGELTGAGDFAGTFAGTGAGGESGTILLGLDVRISAAIAVGACLLRLLFGWWHARGRGRAAGMLTAVAGLASAFYGVNVLLATAAWGRDRLEDRAVVAAAGDRLEELEKALPWWKGLREGAGQLWPLLVEALVEPLTWLIVAALVYGAFTGDARVLLRGTRPETAAGRVEHGRALSRAALGLRERWVPPLHAFRLVTRGGAVLFGMFCLCHVAFRVGADYADRGVRTLIGSDFPHFWALFGSPLEFAGELVTGVLTVCLLAAAFDLAATRGRARERALTA